MPRKTGQFSLLQYYMLPTAAGKRRQLSLGTVPCLLKSGFLGRASAPELSKLDNLEYLPCLFELWRGYGVQRPETSRVVSPAFLRMRLLRALLAHHRWHVGAADTSTASRSRYARQERGCFWIPPFHLGDALMCLRNDDIMVDHVPVTRAHQLGTRPRDDG